jgi:phosphoribosylformylglycinamidine (FGAM) synthase-like amidotransferase family enzyme
MSISNKKGDIGEAAFVLASAKKGYWTGKMPQGCPYDFVLDKQDGKLLRVQVKFRSLEENGTVTIKLVQNTFTNRSSYNANNIDYIAVYVNELDKVYLVPIDNLSGVNEVKLRCIESTKRKDKNSRMIEEYAEW